MCKKMGENAMIKNFYNIQIIWIHQKKIYWISEKAIFLMKHIQTLRLFLFCHFDTCLHLFFVSRLLFLLRALPSLPPLTSS